MFNLCMILPSHVNLISLIFVRYFVTHALVCEPLEGKELCSKMQNIQIIGCT